MLKGKHIILGVTGSIAAYKAATLTRLLVKEGANVKVVMTPLAKEFITPLTMATLSKSPIMVDFYNPENGDWNSHVDLGLWADLYLIAPASANTIGKMAGGIADNLLLTTYLSAKCPVMVAPAMDLDMYKHPATQRNLKVLQSFGNIIIEPESGELASGLIGKGRMEEPERIVAFIADYFARQEDFKGKKVLCGGTTATIISRELQFPLQVSMDITDKELPPLSYMEGIDLITEGILTLSKVERLLTQGVPEKSQGPANDLVNLIQNSDKITFIVGTRINVAHQDPNLPVELEIRRNVVKKIKYLLETKYLKDVEIMYI